jgi:hypothetical protein
VATIGVTPDNVLPSVWWLTWAERNEVVAKVAHVPGGQYQVIPQGPHWSPMKSFAGKLFESPLLAADEVSVYFKHR